jgi:hypothetical protein
VVAAEAVDSSAGRSGGGAKKNVFRGSGVSADRGAEKKLAEGVGAAGDVASDEVGVVGFELRGRFGGAGDDEIFEAGSEAFDLRFDGGGHVGGGVGRDVAVGPDDVEGRSGEWRVMSGE